MTKLDLKGSAFCTFCMDQYDPNRIGSHVRRCRDRRADADCVQLNGRPHPSAYLLMVTIEGRPEQWVCLEAHGESLFAELDRGLRMLWFPEIQLNGVFRPGRRLQRRLGSGDPIDAEHRLDSILEVKDRFNWTLHESLLTKEVNLEVVGYLPTAIMHCIIDVVAFPRGSNAGRFRSFGERDRAWA